MIQDYAELVSIGMTIPTIFLACFVVALWGPGAYSAVKRGLHTSTDWFIAGVAIGFLGAVLDNTYWQLAWCASYMELDSADELIQYGVFFNIVSRQLLGIAAAYCHIKSYTLHDENLPVTRWLNMVCLGSAVIGLFNVFSIVAYRYMP